MLLLGCPVFIQKAPLVFEWRTFSRSHRFLCLTYVHDCFRSKGTFVPILGVDITLNINTDNTKKTQNYGYHIWWSPGVMTTDQIVLLPNIRLPLTYFGVLTNTSVLFTSHREQTNGHVCCVQVYLRSETTFPLLIDAGSAASTGRPVLTDRYLWLTVQACDEDLLPNDALIFVPPLPKSNREYCSNRSFHSGGSSCRLIFVWTV